MHPNDAEILKAATDFRQALDSAGPAAWKAKYIDFPRGSCGHAWLEWNGLTIDVSGDQFGWPPVIVTRDPPFHGRGEDEQ